MFSTPRLQSWRHHVDSPAQQREYSHIRSHHQGVRWQAFEDENVLLHLEARGRVGPAISGSHDGLGQRRIGPLGGVKRGHTLHSPWPHLCLGRGGLQTLWCKRHGAFSASSLPSLSPSSLSSSRLLLEPLCEHPRRPKGDFVRCGTPRLR